MRLAPVLVLMAGCASERLLPIDEGRPLDDVAPGDPIAARDPRDASEPRDAIEDDDVDDGPDVPDPLRPRDELGCAGAPRLLDAGYLYEAAALPSGEVALASSSGTWLFDPSLGEGHVLHGGHAWRVTVAGNRLFALTMEDGILAFGDAATADASPPTAIASGDAHIIDLAASAERLFFTEEVPGRLRSVTLDGADPQEHLDAEIAHELVVDVDAIYVAGWIGGGSTIGRASADGSTARFFDAFENALADGATLSSAGRTDFSSALALTQDETHVYFSTSIAPGGIARVSKETSEWSVLQRLPGSFAMELFVHDGWIYFSESEVTDGAFTGRLLRMPVAGGDVDAVLDCGPSVRILGAAGGYLYLSMDANGAAPFLTRVALE